MVFIDLAKAFDSVSHEHLKRALVQRRADPAFIALICNAYEGCSTRVHTRDGWSNKIAIKVGVKQGDPLSPFCLIWRSTLCCVCWNRRAWASAKVPKK